MRLFYSVSLSLLLGTGLCCAKKLDVTVMKKSSPMQMGNVLAPLSSMTMTTAEISAYMPGQKLLFVVSDVDAMEVLDLKNPAHPKRQKNVALKGVGSSVSVNGNLIAVSSLAPEPSDTGFVEIFKMDGVTKTGVGKGAGVKKVAEFRLCHQPDMLTFSPDGRKLLVACEGSPDAEFENDPAGGIAVLSLPENDDDLANGVKVNVLGFEDQDSTALMKAGVRRIGAAPFYKTLEPEYITVSEDSKVAWVSLQENNAMARVDLTTEKITNVFPFGFVDHSKPGFGIDAKGDGKASIENIPVHGLRQPDGMANITLDGKTFVLTANEGAPVNDYKDWTDATTPLVLFEQNKLDQSVFDAAMLSKLQKLTVSRLDGCPEVVSGKCPYLTSFGSRSMSIFDGTTGALIWDSGDQLEQMFAKVAPEYFNWNAKKAKFKKETRSADKGCEPENVTIGMVGDKRYAFLGLERMSGVAVFDITDVNAPKLVDYYLDPKDRGPEGILFISADKSPVPGQALLIVGYEYSKTLTIYKVN